QALRNRRGDQRDSPHADRPRAVRGDGGGALMPVFQSRLDTDSEEFRLNSEANRRRASELRALLERVREGGLERARSRHVERGKLLARDRIAKLLDPDSSWLEVAPLAAHEV